MSTQGTALQPASRPVRVLQVVALVLVAAFTVTTLPGVRPGPGFHPLSDGWLQGTAYVALAVVAVLRPVTRRDSRRLWTLIAIAVSLRALGFVLYLSYVRLQVPAPHPSVADAAWLSTGVVLLVALWLLVRAKLRYRSWGVLFDALLAALTAAGLTIAVLFRLLERINDRPDPDELVATNLAYPLLDLALLVLVASVLVAFGVRSGAALLLTAGIAGFAVVDAIFAYQATAETYRPGTLLAALSMVATTAIAFSGWFAPPDFESASPTVLSRLERTAIPAGLVLVAVGVLVFAAVHPVPLGAVLLSAAAVAVGTGRAVLTLARDRGAAEDSLRAKNVELARLADDRQLLLDRLVEAQEDERARIAADVHDDSVQALAAVELRLGLLRRQLEASDPELLGTATTLAETVSHAIDRLRHLLFDLESPAAETDLVSSLRIAADTVFEGSLRWRVEGDTALDVPPSLRVTAYRIAREAMVNVAKHAAAEQVLVRASEQDAGVCVVVEDDGVGFDTDTVVRRPGHLGLESMADRATIAGGRFAVRRRPEGGTRVELWLPVPTGDTSAAEGQPATGHPEGSA